MSSPGKKKIEIKAAGEASKDINVTPLIDVVLVLLIIFMVITPIIINEMAVNLPDKTETVTEDNVPQDQLVAAVYEDGSIALNLKSMSLDELKDQVSKRLRGRKPKVVFVDAHPDARYDKVVQLMDAVREAGAEKVALAALKDEGPARPIVGGAAPVAPATPPTP